MKNGFRLRLLFALLFVAFFLLQNAKADSEFHFLQQLVLPANFKITIFAKNVEDARQMALGDKNTIFVGTRRTGKIYALISDKNYQSATVRIIASHLNMPNGVAFLNGSLFVAETNRILRFDHIENNLSNPPKPTIFAQLPDQSHHHWRYIKFGPDKKLYVGIGAPCNICSSDNPLMATLSRIGPSGKDLQVYAKGIRNTVGFDWDPITKYLWFTDNGRDWLGENMPPDEINVAPAIGMHFGFPYCHGKNTPDPIFGIMHSCRDFTPPAFELPAHVAALGVTFYTGASFPEEYHRQMFIAEHGSWNRLQKIGYQVMTAKIENKSVIAVKPFISGWLQSGKVFGRPVDVLVLRDGSLLISDDYANVIYRVTYQKQKNLVNPLPGK